MAWATYLKPIGELLAQTRNCSGGKLRWPSERWKEHQFGESKILSIRSISKGNSLCRHSESHRSVQGNEEGVWMKKSTHNDRYSLT